MTSTLHPPIRPLDGRTALVTGASKGIGAAVCESLANAGARLVVSARDRDELDALAARLTKEYGVDVAAVACDLAETGAHAALARDAWEAFDGLDVLVNNAGISITEPAVEVTTEHWDAVMGVNLRAPALLAADVGRRMAERGHGSIITIASAAGLRALPEHFAYCISKAGLMMATKVLALELGHHGVRANSICPTVVLTEMGTRVWGEPTKAAPMLARIPLGHFAQPSDVGDAVVFLASDASSMLNGVDLPLDGGYTIS